MQAVSKKIPPEVAKILDSFRTRCLCKRIFVDPSDDPFCQFCDPDNLWEGNLGAYLGPYCPWEDDVANAGNFEK